MDTAQIETSETSQQILRSLENIAWGEIVVALVAAWLFVTAIHRIVPWLAERVPSRFRLTVLSFGPVLRLLIVLAASLHIALNLIQPSTQNILAIAGASAVALGFAFKDYISSVIAGVVAIYERPYRPGDWIEMSGYYGEVHSIGLRAVEILTPEDNMVTVPHGLLWNAPVANFSNGRRELMCVITFYVQPAHDAQMVRRTLWDVAITSPYVQPYRPILIWVMEQPWATRYELRAYPVDARNQFEFKTDLTVRGKAALADLGVQPANLPPLYTMQNPNSIPSGR